MAENESTGDDQKEVIEPPKSPWKTPAPAPVPADKGSASSGDDDSDSWPALADAQQMIKSGDSSSAAKLPSLPPQQEIGSRNVASDKVSLIFFLITLDLKYSFFFIRCLY